MDELLDIVDSNDKVIGQKLRSEVYAAGMSNFRVVNGFARDSSGLLWIPRRLPGKKLFPSALDMSVGGHVKSGETYDEAFARETMEELNVSLETLACRILGRLSPSEHGVSAFMTVYEFVIDFDPDYCKDDFHEFFWIAPQDLLFCMMAGEKHKDDLPILIKQFYT